MTWGPPCSQYIRHEDTARASNLPSGPGQASHLPLPPECQLLRQSHAPAAAFPMGIPDSAGTSPLPLPAVESWVWGLPSV